MPPERPKKIEDLLQRYAKERRGKAGDPSLHPATRRLLQGEVARQFASKKEKSSRGLGWLTCPRRFAFGVGLAAVVCAGVWIFTNDGSKAPLQMADSKTRGFDSTAAPSLKNEQLHDRPSESFKELAAVSADTEMKIKRAEKPVALQRAGSAKLEDERRKVPSDAPATGNRFALSAPATTNVTLNFFAGFDIGERVADADGYAVSLAPAQNQVNAGPANISAPPTSVALNNSGFLMQENLARTPQPGGAGALDNLSLFGTLVTNGTMLADNVSPVPHQQDPLGVAAPAVSLLQKDSSSPAQRPSELSQIARAQTAPASRAIHALDSQSQLRADAIVNTPLSAAIAPITAEPLASSGVAEEKSKTDGAGNILGRKAEASALAANEREVRFRRVNAPVSQDRFAKTVTVKVAPSSAPPSPVLDHFTIEQRGQTVHLVDADGSRYDGYIDAPLSAGVKLGLEPSRLEKADKRQMIREDAPGLKEPNINMAREYSFRASGSNVTLGQLVIITGKFTQETNALLNQENFSAARKQSAARAAAPVTTSGRVTLAIETLAEGAASTTNSRVAVEGTVRIGTTNLQWFRAVREPH